LRFNIDLLGSGFRSLALTTAVVVVVAVTGRGRGGAGDLKRAHEAFLNKVDRSGIEGFLEIATGRGTGTGTCDCVLVIPKGRGGILAVGCCGRRRVGIDFVRGRGRGMFEFAIELEVSVR
jgi:hypothetical protein